MHYDAFALYNFLYTMKKSAFIFLLLSSAIYLPVLAEKYVSEFNAWLLDGNYAAADSVLRLWESATPDDPELYSARFNYRINQSREEILVLSGDTNPDGEHLVLTDSAGMEAGSISSRTLWNDSIMELAMCEIDRGIAACPDRLDFRLGKAYAAAVSGRYALCAHTMEAMLERCANNGFAWLTAGNQPQDSARSLVADACFERLRDIATAETDDSDDIARDLAANILELFPDDARVLNIAGALAVAADNTEQALQYFDAAIKAAPDDPLLLLNKAYLLHQCDDDEAAIQICNDVAANPDFDREWRDEAVEMAKQYSQPRQKMEPYYYFFRYLPMVAQQIHDAGAPFDISLINSRIPRANDLISPFADDEISATTVRHGDREITVWTFPEPDDVPLCLYVAFVPAKGDEPSRFLTLEKSFENRWVMGMQQADSHSNFGDIDRPSSPEKFVRTLAKRGIIK